MQGTASQTSLQPLEAEAKEPPEKDQPVISYSVIESLIYEALEANRGDIY